MRTQRKTKKVIRGGGLDSVLYSHNWVINIPYDKLLPRELAAPDATIYYGPAISHKEYRYSRGYETFECMLNTTDACKNAAAANATATVKAANAAPANAAAPATNPLTKALTA